MYTKEWMGVTGGLLALSVVPSDKLTRVLLLLGSLIRKAF